MLIVLLIVFLCAGFALADSMLSFRISWRVLHGRPSADLQSKRVDGRIVDFVWLVALVVWALGYWQST